MHKTASLLISLFTSVQPRAKTLIYDKYMAETEAAANKAFDHICESYRDELLTFYPFPTAHWKHIRNTNVIESVFATVRLRTYKKKGLGTRNATLAMPFKYDSVSRDGRFDSDGDWGYGNYYAPLVTVVCGNKENTPWGDHAVEDCFVAMENMLIAATAMGLGSVWIGGFDRSTKRT